MEEGLKALAAAFGRFVDHLGHRQFRHRVNVSQTSKGIESFDCTVEGTGYTREEILAESDSLTAALRTRYHPEG